jgi:hypothetical protein
MRTRLIVISAFLCAAILPAVLAAALYMQARHVHCIWSADYCVPLNGLIFDGSILRGSTFAFGVEAITFGALAGWRWMAEGKIDWTEAIIWALFLCALVILSWILSSWALDVYQRLYDIAPARPAYDAERARQYKEMLYNASRDYGGFELGLGVLATAFLVTCVIKIWSAFDLQDLDHEIAAHEEHRRHEHPEATH